MTDDERKAWLRPGYEIKTLTKGPPGPDAKLRMFVRLTVCPRCDCYHDRLCVTALARPMFVYDAVFTSYAICPERVEPIMLGDVMPAALDHIALLALCRAAYFVGLAARWSRKHVAAESEIEIRRDVDEGGR